METMKRIIKGWKSIGVLLMLLISYNGFGQTEKLYIVINEATWCKYCKAHGARVNKVISEFSSGKEIIVLHNDVTDANTSKKNDPRLKTLGIYDYVSHHKEAAMVYVFDSKTKKVIDGFRLKSEDEIILKVLENSLSKTK